MRVLYITHSGAKDGSSTALLNIAIQLKDKVDIYIVGARNGYIINECQRHSINCSVITMYESIYPPLKSIRDLLLFFPRLARMILANRMALPKLRDVIAKQKPDIIHTNTGVLHTGHLAAENLSIPHVWHIREYQDLFYGWVPFPSKKSFLKKISSPNNYPIAISQGVYTHHQLAASSSSSVIYDGVLHKNSTCFNASKENYFLFVGRLEEAKGIEQLVDAFIQFCKKEKAFILKIAGNGSSKFTQYLRSKVTSAKLEERIIFLGFQDDITSLMSRATALIVPSRFEGFGFITVEAMFYGCLVVGNNSAGTKEILEPENLGILYSGTQELVDALVRIKLNGVNHYYPMIERAQERAVTLYSIEKNAESIYSLYSSILN